MKFPPPPLFGGTVMVGLNPDPLTQLNLDPKHRFKPS